MARIILSALAAILIGYLLGSCNGAILISCGFYREDIRTRGSGNAGLTNFYRCFGGPATLLVIVIDMGKIFLAAWLGGLLAGEARLAEGQALCGTAAILGHMFPVWYGFRGGKGILSSGALVLFMSPPAFLFLLVVFTVTVALTRYVSLGSILAALLYPVCFLVLYRGHPVVVLLSLVGLLDVWRHRENIRRLRSGTESKFTFKKKDGDPTGRN